MNLLKDAWVPVKYEGAARQITLKELLCTDDHYVLSHPRDDMELSALQLLVCLAQCIFMPADKDELKQRFKQPMSVGEFDEEIQKYEDWFALDHPQTPFMQDITVVGRGAKNKNPKGETTDIQKLFVGMPEGASSSTFFVDAGTIDKVCPSCAAIALFNQATNAPSFGGGSKDPLRGAAPLTSLVYDADLRLAVWKNIMDQEWLKSYHKDFLKIDLPVWIDKIVRNSQIQISSIGMVRGLFWQPASLQLSWQIDSHESICPSCGLPHKVFCKTFWKNSFIYECLGPMWQHPHSPYIFTKDQKQRVSYFTASFNHNSEIPLWSKLEDILPISRNPQRLCSSAWVIEHYNSIRAYNTPLPLIIGGYRNNSSKILERRHQIMSIGAGWIDDKDKLAMLHNLIYLALEYCDALVISSYKFGDKLDEVKNTQSTKKKTLNNEVILRKWRNHKKIDTYSLAITAKTINRFYQETEPIMHAYIADNNGFKADMYSQLSTELRKKCMLIFTEVVNPYIGSVNAFKAYVENSEILAAKLNRIVNRFKQVEIKGGNEPQ